MLVKSMGIPNDRLEEELKDPKDKRSSPHQDQPYTTEPSSTQQMGWALY